MPGRAFFCLFVFLFACLLVGLFVCWFVGLSVLFCSMASTKRATEATGFLVKRGLVRGSLESGAG